MAVGRAIFLEIIFEQVRAFIDLIGRLADHFVDADTLEGALWVANETTG